MDELADKGLEEIYNLQDLITKELRLRSYLARQGCTEAPNSIEREKALLGDKAEAIKDLRDRTGEPLLNAKKTIVLYLEKT